MSDPKVNKGSNSGCGMKRPASTTELTQVAGSSGITRASPDLFAPTAQRRRLDAPSGNSSYASIMSSLPVDAFPIPSRASLLSDSTTRLPVAGTPQRFMNAPRVGSSSAMNLDIAGTSQSCRSGGQLLSRQLPARIASSAPPLSISHCTGRVPLNVASMSAQPSLRHLSSGPAIARNITAAVHVLGRQSPAGLRSANVQTINNDENGRSGQSSSESWFLQDGLSQCGAAHSDYMCHSYDENVQFPCGTLAQSRLDSIANSRLLAELRQLEESPLAGCHASPREDSIRHWTVVIDGPSDTVYEGGTFFVDLIFTDHYPYQAPKVEKIFTLKFRDEKRKVVFLTRIYHCNIDSQGKVCMDPISRGWTSCMTISTVLQSLISLLYACNPKDALVPYIAEQYVKNPDEYQKMARIWTQRYAQ